MNTFGIRLGINLNQSWHHFWLLASGGFDLLISQVSRHIKDKFYFAFYHIKLKQPQVDVKRGVKTYHIKPFQMFRFFADESPAIVLVGPSAVFGPPRCRLSNYILYLITTLGTVISPEAVAARGRCCGSSTGWSLTPVLSLLAQSLTQSRGKVL